MECRNVATEGQQLLDHVLSRQPGELRVTEDLIDIAVRASRRDVDNTERNLLNLRFQKLVNKFHKVVDNARQFDETRYGPAATVLPAWVDEVLARGK